MSTHLRLIAGIPVHMDIKGKQKLVRTVPYDPYLDVRVLEKQEKMEIQGIVVQRSDLPAPEAGKYSPLVDVTPPIQPGDALWIKAKKRSGETCEHCKGPGADVLWMPLVSCC
jgi:hypothetical protein